MCHSDEEIQTFWQKSTPTSFQAGFWQNGELRLGTFSWIVSQLDCKWNYNVFLSLTLKMQGNWENWRNSFCWSANRENCFRWNDFWRVVRNSEIFPRKCRNFLVVREPRQHFCQVVRESEKVENHWSKASPNTLLSFILILHKNLANCAVVPHGTSSLTTCYVSYFTPLFRSARKQFL